MGRETAHFLIRSLGPWGGAKRPNTIKFQLQSIFQRFLNQTLCLLTNERYKTYQTGFSFGHLGHAPGWDLWVPWGLGGQKCFFSEIQLDLVCELLTLMAHATVE